MFADSSPISPDQQWQARKGVPMRIYPQANGSYTNYHVDLAWAIEEMIVHYNPTPPGEIYITQPGGSDALILGPLSVPQMRQLVEALQEAIRDREPDELRAKEYRARLKGELGLDSAS